MSGDFRGEHFNIAMQGLKCGQCGYSTIHGRDSALFSRRLADAFRVRHGLLTSDEIKAARSRIGKSQEEFARYLRVGVASIKRWESGQVQDEAMNELIRLKTDLWAAEQNVVVVRAALTATEQTFEETPPSSLQGRIIVDYKSSFGRFLDTSAVHKSVWPEAPIAADVLQVIRQPERTGEISERERRGVVA